jgi:hypothetical protein
LPAAGGMLRLLPLPCCNPNLAALARLESKDPGSMSQQTFRSAFAAFARQLQCFVRGGQRRQRAEIAFHAQSGFVVYRAERHAALARQPNVCVEVVEIQAPCSVHTRTATTNLNCGTDFKRYDAHARALREVKRFIRSQGNRLGCARRINAGDSPLQ